MLRRRISRVSYVSAGRDWPGKERPEADGER